MTTTGIFVCRCGVRRGSGWRGVTGGKTSEPREPRVHYWFTAPHQSGGPVGTQCRGGAGLYNSQSSSLVCGRELMAAAAAMEERAARAGPAVWCVYRILIIV
ncbi:hypothetical protein E2C01_078106 [Portunus trituberculatus]|uniref:Uncharacterized protein n=1 Tax=Portunus trituberculatus TaxID=210409 RepID=A0A5B7IP55_PORTR|nr:hypothetical protein [Portunus trituberculatus]